MTQTGHVEPHQVAPELAPRKRQHDALIASVPSMIRRYYPNFRNQVTIYRDAVLRHFPPGATVLDAGCGRGGILHELRGRARRAVGVDVDPQAVTGNEHLDDIVITDLGDLPFPDESFDLVISEWVVEHLAHPEEAWREVARVLRPGGAFVLVTPNRHHPVVILTRLTSLAFHQTWKARLYGIAEDDVFPKYYRANTLAAVDRALTQLGLHRETLELATNPAVFCIAKPLLIVDLLFERLCDLTHLPFLRRISKTGVVACYVKS